MRRINDADVEATMAAAETQPDDLDTNLVLADLELGAGDIEAAFERLIAVIKRGRARA